MLLLANSDLNLTYFISTLVTLDTFMITDLPNLAISKVKFSKETFSQFEIFIKLLDSIS
jgi:hypothetical protein